MLRKILYCSYSAFLLESYELKSVEILNLSIKMSKIWILENEKLKKNHQKCTVKIFFQHSPKSLIFGIWPQNLDLTTNTKLKF